METPPAEFLTMRSELLRHTDGFDTPSPAVRVVALLVFVAIVGLLGLAIQHACQPKYIRHL